MSNTTTALQAEVDRLRLEVHSLQSQAGAGRINVGNYLLDRLVQLGVTHIFGLPGDFNLGFLDLIEDHPKLQWVGNCNELNAAYAADGYARVKSNSLGVILTTFGVGELSAINGIAGAFSEMVPVLHIVGVPSTTQHKNRPLLHHTLGDGRYNAYREAAAPFVILEENLMDKNTAANQIDNALTQCITKARPVYMSLPTDTVYKEISSERLKIPLSHSQPMNDPQMEEYVIDSIFEKVKEAEGDVVVLTDAGVIRYGVRKEVAEFLKETGFPVYATPMGKTAIDESWDRYGGIYVGSLTHPSIKEKVENAKVMISIGLLSSDFNTGNFSYNIPTRRSIELHSSWTKIQYGMFDGIGMKQLLPKLTERLQHFYPVAHKIPVPQFQAIVPPEHNQTISHAWFWPRLAKFFQPGDVIVTETGTSNFGILDIPLPSGCRLISQVLWGSIGWSVGDALGAALAAREKGMNRVVLFVGDGSLQLTVQELSPMIRNGLKPIIFVLNNKGYTIERCIHGKHRKYNDVANWNWPALLDVFNDSGKFETGSHVARNKDDVSMLLDDKKFNGADKMQIVEIQMEALDAPKALERQAAMTGATNRGAMQAVN
ncbi:pyruvate decarboxylase THI3 [Panaeolus papilionaceus]|nr:pyruvate decarboxylase THI3 [Panaeolus papilionaceus]